MNKALGFILIAFSAISCGKNYSDSHTQDEVIIEFAARLEEQFPEHQYNHSNHTNQSNHSNPSKDLPANEVEPQPLHHQK